MKYVVTILTALLLTSCEEAPSSQQIERQQQERMSLQAVRSVGMPAITNFQEKKMLKNILELRDQQIRTYTYTQDLNAGLHKLCDSIGYGIPYGTQYTSPQMTVRPYSGVYITLPQADPNGLFSPPSAEGTWVLCMDPGSPDKELKPVYVEPRVLVSPFPLVPEKN